MPNNAEQYLSQLKKSNAVRSGIRHALPALSLLVVLSVFWGLKLTGITMAGEAFCGKAEHVHSEECPTQSLICTLEETEGHTHSEACILRELTCTEAESEGHAHSDTCHTRTLVCTLEETEGHTHADSCNVSTLTCLLPEQEGHVHTQDCAIQTLVCTEEETEGHSHDDGCITRSVICGMEESGEHVHDDSCFSEALSCTQEESPGHFHGESCYILEEGFGCGLEEAEGHTHSPDCYLTELGCALDEIEAHIHADSCYQMEEALSCGLEEMVGHAHTDLCYRIGAGFSCGLAEADGHIHAQECVAETTELGCGKAAAEAHAHTETCFESLEACPLEEHIHDESCYSDITADVETSDDWEMTLAGITRSPSTLDNIISVARSQLGYTESTRNFQVDALGIRRGYTRYGQWYGSPYGDWSAMFVSFCLHYAGAEDLPANAGPESMRLEWLKAQLYRAVTETSPLPGYVLFLDKEGTGVADSTAIITAIEEEQLLVIEGDLEDAVTETAYSLSDPAILGYGIIPTEPELMVLSEPPENAMVIASATDYDQTLFTSDNAFVLYTVVGSNYYAFDGNGNAIQIYIDDSGNIYSDTEDPDQLLWTFAYEDTNTYLIRNLVTGRYMHAYANNGGGVTTSGAYSSVLVPSGSGVKIRSNTEYARLDAGSGVFQMTQNQSSAAVYQFGILDISNRRTLWFDGTNGGIKSLVGSPDKSYSASVGDVIRLPDSWQPPDKYSYVLRGWYDVVNNAYYTPGAEYTVQDNAVFYADWVAESYDIGQFNSQVSSTVSTNKFVTARIFDYNPLFNLLSSSVDCEISAMDHHETWSLITDGSNPYNGSETLDFIFRDWDSSSEDITYPANINSHNTYSASIPVHQGLYTSTLRKLLFGTDNSFDPDTGTGVIGKQYLGTGDYLFQLMTDPSDPHYGYYYYDSSRNAASYNQSEQRFYVYDYLERTSDSAGASDEGQYSDFLPLNSPYANTNGNFPSTYNYSGTTNFTYEAAGGGSSDVAANYHFGMSIDVRFFLPNAPGAKDENGDYGNRDLYGNEMHFQFSGDDDVWVFVDDTLVLDLGGIHGIEKGDINFATGIVTVDGAVDQALTNALSGIPAGEHTLTIYYLERGSSQSNCAIYFNLAPRFSLSIQKEDVLTQELLNGAQFSVYTDEACTVPAQLWVSEAAHDSGAAATNVFTVTNGVANMWGFASGNTYYIKETKPPDAAGYNHANGIIRLTIDKQGIATYDVEIIEDSSGSISNGFTVHGIKIDEETQKAYIVATNAPEWVKDVTTVQVLKQWKDSVSHSGDYVTAYLTVTDPDGTVRRIREIILSQENDWTYTWTNLPKYAADGVTPIEYGIQEAYVPGYQAQIQEVEEFTIVTETWAEAYSLQNGQTYVIKTASGCLSTTGDGSDTGFRWITEDAARSSPYALWTVRTSGNTFKLTNGAGQTLTLYYNGGSPTDFFSSTGGETNASKQYFRYVAASGGIRLYYGAPNGWDYYLTASMNSSGKFGYSTSSGNGLILVPMTKISTAHTQTVSGWGFQIDNTPLEEETSLAVSKVWNLNGADSTEVNYLQSQVTIKLLADGAETGRTVTLNLKNNWQDVFQGLPYTDAQGNVIVYTVEEVWSAEGWTTLYGDIVTTDGDPPTYSTTVTNTYRTEGPVLPSTGSAARLMYILCGSAMMLLSLVCGLGLRRKRERRFE